MKYKAKEVSRITGIPVDTLRYFEKIGVISPKIDDSNNYRYYSAWDINLRNALRFPGLPFLLHFSTESCIIPRGKRDLFQRKNHGRTRRGKKT